MVFETGLLNDPRQVGAGEIQGDNNTILSARDFQDSLQAGSFARIAVVAGVETLSNLDPSVTAPLLAGVVLRKASSAVEDGSAIRSDLRSYAEYLRDGLVTVEGIAGETPTKFAKIYARNAGADIGKASVLAANGVDASAEFIEVLPSVDNRVIWLVRLK